MRKYLLTLLLLPLLALTAAAQDYQAEPFEAALLQTRTGARLVYNGPRHSFSLELVGKLDTTGIPDFVRLNGRLLQTLIIPFQTQLNFGHLSVDTQKKALLGFQQYEENYLTTELGIIGTHKQIDFQTVGGQLCLLWSYDTPSLAPSTEVSNPTKGQRYLLTICHDQILVLNIPLEELSQAAAARAQLLKLAGTIKLYDTPQDLHKLYNQLTPKG